MTLIIVIALIVLLTIILVNVYRTDIKKIETNLDADFQKDLVAIKAKAAEACELLSTLKSLMKKVQIVETKVDNTSITDIKTPTDEKMVKNNVVEVDNVVDNVVDIKTAIKDIKKDI
jgi:hypothetical protein